MSCIALLHFLFLGYVWCLAGQMMCLFGKGYMFVSNYYSYEKEKGLVIDKKI